MDTKKILLAVTLSILASGTLGTVFIINARNTTYQAAMLDYANEKFDEEIACSSFVFNPFTRELTIKNLRIGSPENYSALFTLNIPRAVIKFETIDVPNKNFVIESIRLGDINLNYEARGSRFSNLSDINDRLSTLTEENLATMTVNGIEANGIVISLTTIRFRREIGNLTTDGFHIRSATLTGAAIPAQEFIKRMYAILFMEAAQGIAKAGAEEKIGEFQKGAEEMLGRLAEEYPYLAKEMKL